MQKILVPCDGSDSALRAIRYAVSVAKQQPDVELELLNVQDPMAPGAQGGLTEHEIKQRQTDNALRFLEPARQILDTSGVTYRVYCRTGSPANEIAQQVYESGCNAVIMGTRGMGPIASVMIGSVATRVVHLANVPVTLIK